MKKLLLLSIALIGSIATAQGKPSAAKSASDWEKIKLGAKIGLNYATWSLDKQQAEALQKENVNPVVPLQRPCFQLYGEMPLNKSLGVEVSFMYSGKGNKMVEKMEMTNANFNYNYFVASPSLRMYPGSDRQFCIFIGTPVSYLLTAKSSSRDNYNNEFLKIDYLGENIPDEQKPRRIDFGILYGLDYEFSSGLLIGSEINIGLINILKESKAPESPSQNAKPKRNNLVFQWYLGYNLANLIN